MKTECDVLIVGGGPAGLGAAIASARMGADTMLIERYGYLGGMATGGYVLSVEGLPVGGIMAEIMERLTEMDGAIGNQVCPEYLKILADEMCLEAGVHLIFHMLAFDWGADYHPGITAYSKTGEARINAKITIDCTGDGDMAAKAGAKYETGTKAIGMNFLIGGIAPYPAEGIWQPEHYPASDIELYWVNVTGVQNKNSRDYPEDLQGQLSAIDVDDLTHAEIENRRRIYKMLYAYKKHKPGWEDARLVAMAPQLGVRESRRIIGIERAVGAEVSETSICSPGGRQIPYGALVPADLDNMFVAGRCISCEREVHDSIRLIPACVATGQAAGTAAVMCLQQDVSPKELVVSELQEQLKKDGVMLE